MSFLDRPIWHALVTRQAEFARGKPPALAFRADVEPFAATIDDSSADALTPLHPAGDILLLLQADPSPVPDGLNLLSEARGVQMVCSRAIDGARPPGAIPLSDADSEEMIDLAQLTKPGPFRKSTHHLGQFWGLRREGKLVAMAGERLKIPGMTELSGVCTHPDWRGHGFAADLSGFVTTLIQQRGETAFLHAYADNGGAIRLYEKLGFTIRREMAVQQFVVESDF